MPHAGARPTLCAVVSVLLLGAAFGGAATAADDPEAAVQALFDAVAARELDDLDGLEAALLAAKEQTTKPSLLVLRSHIGQPSPDHVDTHAAHGNPFSAEDVARTKAVMGIPDEPFWAPDDLVDAYRSHAAERGATARAEWNHRSADVTATPDWRAAWSGTGIDGWSWSFGDGETSKLQNPTHTYTTAGTYTVQVATAGLTEHTSQQFYLGPGVRWPVTFTVPTLNTVAVSAKDTDGNPIGEPVCNWSFNGGAYTIEESCYGTFVGMPRGDYVGELTVVDPVSGCEAMTIGKDQFTAGGPGQPCNRTRGQTIEFIVPPRCPGSVIDDPESFGIGRHEKTAAVIKSNVVDRT